MTIITTSTGAKNPPLTTHCPFLSGVIDTFDPIAQMYANKQKCKHTIAPLVSHTMDNRVFKDNSPVGQWSKGGQTVVNAQTNLKMEVS